MGEIARRIILRLAEEGGLFGRRIPTGLQAQGSLTTPQMSKIDHDTSTDLLGTADVLQEAFGLAVDQITLESTQVVRLTCPFLSSSMQSILTSPNACYYAMHRAGLKNGVMHSVKRT